MVMYSLRRLDLACFAFLVVGLIVALAAPTAAGDPTATKQAGCPAGADPIGIEDAALSCRYRGQSTFEPNHVGGPWVNVDLLNVGLGELQQIRAGTSALTIYPGGPSVPALGLVHAQICLSDPYVVYHRCPNDYPHNRAAAKYGYKLNPDVIKRLEQGLDRLRKAGLKVVLRFTYNYPCETRTGPPRCHRRRDNDAPMGVILRHMRELAPTIRKNSDVVFILQAGFIGRWGEWHNSTSRNDSPVRHNEFLDEYRRLFQGFTNLEVRRPYVVLDYQDHLRRQGRLSDFTAIGLGMHDDEFGSNLDDGGTFEAEHPGDPPKYSTCRLRRTVAALADKFTMTGETSAVYHFGDEVPCGPGVPHPSGYDGFAADYALTTLQLGFSTEVMQNWVRKGVFHQRLRKIGPRLRLNTATLRLDGGGRASLRLRVENTGWAGVANRRPVHLVLHRGGRTILRQEIAFDLTSVVGGATVTKRIDLGSWRDLAPGRYRAFLAAPDVAPRLAGNPAYAFYFDNEGVPVRDAGLNDLGTFELVR